MNIVVLLAGGSGTRMKASVPKQHLIVKDHPVLEYTLTAFCTNEAVDAVLVVSNPSYLGAVQQLQPRFEKLKWVIPGGDTRILSVWHAVSFLKTICTPEDKIVLSDAVRPCITYREVRELLAKLEDYACVTTGVETYEHIMQTKDGSLSAIIPREGVFRQTSPEGYRFQTLAQLYLDTPIEQVREYGCIGIEQLIARGSSVGIVKSTPLNFKITTPEDIYYFDTVLKRGFDQILSGCD